MSHELTGAAQALSIDRRSDNAEVIVESGDDARDDPKGRQSIHIHLECM